MNVAIIKYNAGNIKSVEFSLNRLGINALITDDKEKICGADKIILPGVGEAGSAMHTLRKTGLDKIIPFLKQPIFGICLGMQLLCKYSEEGDTRCIGIFPEKVKKFTGNEKIPHTGWNNIFNLKSTLFEGIPENEFMYFVHSYYVEKSDETIAVTDYIAPFSSAIQRNNFYAVQFHPEKSGDAGQKIMKNFLKL